MAFCDICIPPRPLVCGLDQAEEILLIHTHTQIQLGADPWEVPCCFLNQQIHRCNGSSSSNGGLHRLTVSSSSNGGLDSSSNGRLDINVYQGLLAFLLPLFIWVSQILHFVHLSFLDRTVPIRTTVTLLSIESRCLIFVAATLRWGVHLREVDKNARQ